MATATKTVEHTPGPFSLTLDRLGDLVILGAGGEEVALVIDPADDMPAGAEPTPQMWANGRLLRASADLLAALEEAEAALAVQASYRTADQARSQAALETARAAISRARGEV